MAHSLSEKAISEFLATALFIWLGNAGIANHVLKKTKGNSMGFGFVAFQFGLAVSFAAAVFGNVSAVMNPAGIVCLLISGDVKSGLEAIALISAEFAGAFLGGLLVWITYYPHFQKLSDHHVLSSDLDQVKRLQKRMEEGRSSHSLKALDQDQENLDSWAQDALSCFCNRPAIYHLPSNFICEMLCTFVLQFGLQLMGNRIPASVSVLYSSGLQAFLNGMYIFLLIAAFGGPTGFTANPARDFGPRLAHLVLPIPQKTDSQLVFGLWIVASNFLGGALAGYLFPFFKI